LNVLIVQHFPTTISRTVLGAEQKYILMVLENINLSINCTIKSYAKCKNERNISIEWFAFVKNANMLSGSRVRFTVSDSPELLNVVVMNH
jgi:hypothetical protein